MGVEQMRPYERALKLVNKASEATLRAGRSSPPMPSADTLSAS